MTESILETLIAATPLIKTFLQQDIAIAISDRAHFLSVCQGNKVRFPYKIGDSVIESGGKDICDEIIKTRKAKISYVPKEVAGIEVKSVINPVMNDNDEIVGFCSISQNIDKEASIVKESEELTASLEETNATVQEIASNAEILNDKVSSIIENTKIAEKCLESGNASIDLIQAIASRSNLLGLNASIEAARAGINGKGFAVVAEEMQKLASQSKETAQKVSEALGQIGLTLEAVLQDITETGHIANAQFLSTNEISKTIDIITSSAMELVNLSKSE